MINNSIVRLIREIEKRPTMYIGKGYISCLRSFLDGWIYRSPDDVTDIVLFNNFQSWIERRYNQTKTQSWDRIILFYSVDENDALQNFFRLFQLYIIDEANNDFQT